MFVFADSQQPVSSELSMQSMLWSHFLCFPIHWPLKQVNWSAGHRTADKHLVKRRSTDLLQLPFVVGPLIFKHCGSFDFYFRSEAFRNYQTNVVHSHRYTHTHKLWKWNRWGIKVLLCGVPASKIPSYPAHLHTCSRQICPGSWSLHCSEGSVQCTAGYRTGTLSRSRPDSPPHRCRRHTRHNHRSARPAGCSPPRPTCRRTAPANRWAALRTTQTLVKPYINVETVFKYISISTLGLCDMTKI